MHTEQIDLHGYTVKIKYDQCAENPFECWDCEPPLLAYCGSRHGTLKAYNDAPSDWWDVLRALSGSIFQRKNRVAFLRRFITPLGLDLRTFAEEKRRIGDIDAIATFLCEHLGEKPHGWREATEWLETAASILEYGGIPCHFTQSNGYSQGDSTLLLAIGLPSWVEKVGAPADSVPSQLESACELHGFWQWGDVYGVAEILDSNGDEIPHGSCWGFYGSDHEKSGLMDHARNAIECHERAQEKEAFRLSAALCSLE